MQIFNSAPHNHVCLLYKTKQEKYINLLAFIRSGFILNNKCLYIAMRSDGERVRRFLAKSGKNIQAAIKSGALTFMYLEDFSHDGSLFSTSALLSTIRKDVSGIREQGFSALRVVTEVPIDELASYSPELFISWEQKLNSFLAKNECLTLCKFQADNVPSVIIKALVQNNSITLTGGKTTEKIFAVSSEECSRNHTATRDNVHSFITHEEIPAEIRWYKEWCRTLSYNANEAIIVTQDNSLRYVNHKAEVLTDYSEQELKILSLLDLVHPDDRAMVSQYYVSSLGKKKSIGSHTIRIVTKHREMRWAEINRVNIDWEGKPAQLNLLNDITDRKFAEAALSASEERYRLLVEKANEAIVVVQDGMIKYCNPKAIELACYTEEELYSRPFLEFIHPEDHLDIINRYFARIKGDMSEDVVAHFRLISGKGEVRYEEVRAMVIDWEGRPAVFDMITDVTERKRGEDLLKESEERYRKLVETSPDPIVMYDLMGNFILVNLQTAHSYGVSSIDEFLNEIKNISDLLDDDGRAQAIEDSKMTLNTGFTSKKEYTIYNKIRSPMRVEINSSTINGKDGKPVAFISIVRDISGRQGTNMSLDSITYQQKC